MQTMLVFGKGWQEFCRYVASTAELEPQCMTWELYIDRKISNSKGFSASDNTSHPHWANNACPVHLAYMWQCVQDDGDQTPLTHGTMKQVLDSMSPATSPDPAACDQSESDQQLVDRTFLADLPQLTEHYHPEQLYYRALPGRLPIVNLVVHFANAHPFPYAERVQMYHPILEFWLSKGARVHGRDLVGHTALHHDALGRDSLEEWSRCESAQPRRRDTLVLCYCWKTGTA